MDNVTNFISSEMRYPTDTSKKKKRYVTFDCINCSNTTEKVYYKGFNNLCNHCSKGGFTTEEFIARGREHFGDLYDYSKTSYINTSGKVTIICPKHGEFSQRAREHLAGHGCNLCKFEARSVNQQYTLSHWEDKLKEFPLITLNGLIDGLGYHTPADFNCKIHGDFITTLGSIQQTKHICKECSYVSHQSQSLRTNLIGTTAHLYYVYIDNIDMYKLGVSTNLESRLTTLGNPTLIDSKEMEYSEAIALEHKLMKSLDKYRYKGSVKLIKAGSTELFKMDVSKQIIRALQQ